MATIRITNLKLRTLIGTEPQERLRKQTIILNIQFDFDATQASETDCIEHAVDYKAITNNIIKEVGAGHCFLIERLAKTVLDIIMRHPRVTEAIVRVDKPQAIRCADSVSVELTKKRP
jgi:D-erythro-7,8-dihydroneopterin triphosphate epimerase